MEPPRADHLHIIPSNDGFPQYAREVGVISAHALTRR